MNIDVKVIQQINNWNCVPEKNKHLCNLRTDLMVIMSNNNLGVYGILQNIPVQNYALYIHMII